MIRFRHTLRDVARSVFGGGEQSPPLLRAPTPQILDAGMPPAGGSILLSRRGFLQSIVPATLIAPVLLEELLELPSKTFFLPPSGGWAGEWSGSSLGGYLYSRQLSAVLRNNITPLVRFRDVDIAPRPPATSGKFTWDVYQDADPWRV